jgi:hypothetical protein
MDVVDSYDTCNYQKNTLSDRKSGYQKSRDNSATISNYDKGGRGIGGAMRKDATEPNLSEPKNKGKVVSEADKFDYKDREASKDENPNLVRNFCKLQKFLKI